MNGIWSDLWDTSLPVSPKRTKPKPLAWDGDKIGATVERIGDEISISFPSRPVAGVLNLIKRAQFHYLGIAITWTARFSEERWALAVSLQ